MKVIMKATLKGAFTGVCLGMIPVLHVSHAQQTVDPAAAQANRSAITRSLNGTAVQNIAAPNGTGLSHNKFSTFNVDATGLVINNSSVNAVSRIGGAVVANPHLSGGQASLILNEVTSGNRSILQGAQELLGGRAAYILANPNGITCDGCGFINFPRATLTTGTPLLVNGGVSGFSVNGGDVLIGPGGLNATGADYFDIITRAAAVTGQVNANDLSLVLGRNDVDYATNAATAKAKDGSTAPSFAVDSSTLGGMYAGRISLVGTEAGLGVRLLGTMAASVSDVVLDVSGKISFKDNAVSAERDVVLKSTQPASTAGSEIDLTNATVYARNNTTLQGGDVSLAGGRTGAGQNLGIAAVTYTDTLSGRRDAGNDLTLQVSGGATASGSVLQANRNLAITANSLGLQAGARVMGEADGVGANGGALGATSVAVAGALSIQDAALFSRHTASISAGSLTIDADSNDSGAQGIRGAGLVTVSATSIDNAGLVASDSVLSVNAGTLTNRATGIVQGASATLHATTLANAGDIGSTGALAVHADSLTNETGGALLANGALTLQGNGAAATVLANQSGAAIKGQTLAATFGTIVNSGELYGNSAVTLTADSLTNSTGALISTPGSLTLQQQAAGGTLSNAGNIEGRTLSATYGTISNTAGRIFGDDSANLVVGSLNNAAQLSSDGALTINAGAARGANLTNTGSIDGSQLGVYFDNITNSGALYGGTSLNAGATTLTNNKSIASGGTMGLEVLDLVNTPTVAGPADIYAIGNLSITGNHTLSNVSAGGVLASIASRDGALTIDSRSGAASTQSVTNSGGLLFSGTDLTALVSREFVNQNWVGMRAYTFANTGNMLLGAPDSATLLASAQAVTVRNVDSDIESHMGDIQLNASQLLNTTDAAPVKTWVFLGRRTSGLFDYDGTLDNQGDLLQVYNNCGSFYDNFDESRQGHRCATWVDAYQEQMTNPNTAPRAKLISGRNLSMYIENQALNYISLISAAGNITVSGAPGSSFENRAETLRYEEWGNVLRYDDGGVTHNPAGDCYIGPDYYKCFFGHPADPAPNDSLSHLKKFTNISLTGAAFSYSQGIRSTVQAGGAININIGQVTNSSTGETIVAVAAPGATAPSAAATDPNAPRSVGMQAITTGILAAISSLSSSPFFIQSSNPTSPFLFETNPRLMSLAGLFGSDLFLKSLGLDPAAYLRAGDPYFEQQLLRQQLLAQAGQLFIADGLAGENAQYKYLMENAVAAKDDLQLRMGVALTAEQIANLRKDIVWMVETVVAGKKVLVPQLYLSDATRAKLADGARFVASNIDIKTEGAITNSGAFVASNTIAIDAGTTFTNRLGTLVAANGLSISATGDILNQSGTIRAGDVSLDSRQGSVINETLTRDITVHGSQGSGTSTIVGATASITATNNLDIKAAQDITSRGGEITAGKDATLDAGRDITFTAIEKKSLTSSVTNSQADGFTTTKNESTQKTELVGSGLTVGGNLDAKAARDINIEASSVDVAGGGRIDAGRNINVTALGETSKSEERTSTSSWNTNSNENTTVELTTGKASTLNFGGSLTVASGADTNIKGSDVAVGGDLNVERIGGNLNVTTFENTAKVTSTTTQRSFFGGEAKADAGDNITQSKASATATLYSNSEETLNIDSTSNRGSGISVGGNLNAGTGAIAGDVNIVGSNVATGGDMNLAAGGNINVLAAEDKTTVTSSSKSTAFYLGGEASIDGANAKFGVDHAESNGTATQTTVQVSGLSSGGNMSIKAAGDFTEQGTQVAAGGNIAVEANRITSLAAQNTYTETGDSLAVSVSIGIKAETGLGGLVGSFIDDKGKADFNMAGASQSLNELSVPDAGSVSAELSISTTKTTSSSSGSAAVTSSFSSGGNISFTAREGDATFVGTNVEAAGAIDVSAAKGSVNILAAQSQDTATTSTTKAEVTIGVSMDGTFSGSGSGSTESESTTTTTQTAASFRAGTDLSLSAKNDVILVGTNLAAGGTASITAEEGKIDFQAARDTSTSTSSSVSANASFSANITGKEGSVGGGGGTLDTSESSSTGTAGSLAAGSIVLKSKGDITLEGTKVAAVESATIETQGKVDFKAVENTHTRTSTGESAQVDLEFGATGGGGTVAGSKTEEFEQSSIKTGGSLSAANLTIKAGTGVRLEGTQVDVSKDASIDTGTGKLVLESAVSTTTKRVNNTAVEVGAKGDLKEGSGQGSLKVEGSYEDTQKTTNQNVALNIGGKADIKAAGGIDIKGTNITGVDSVVRAGSLQTNGAVVSIEQRQDVDKSTKTNVDLNVGVIVPGKKARKEVSDLVQKASDSKAATTIRNKAANAKASVSNAVDTLKTKAKNTASDISTAAKNVGADAATRKANNDANTAAKDANNKDLVVAIKTTKDTATATKLTNTTAYADRKATAAEAAISADQSNKDKKAAYDQQKADDRATAEREKALGAIDPAQDAQAQEAAKAKIQADFEAKKKANAETADKTKQENASAALQARSNYADTTADRKDAAEAKAADSQVRHVDESSKTQLALASQTSDATARDEKKLQIETAKIDSTGKLQGDRDAKQIEIRALADKTKADNLAKKTRIDADLSAQTAAKTDIDKARQEQTAEDAKVDAKAGLSPQQKADAKKENADTAERAIKTTNESLATAKEANAKTEADALLGSVTAQEKSRADAELARQTVLANAERDRLALVPTADVKKAVQKAEDAMQAKVAEFDKTLAETTAKLNNTRKDEVKEAQALRDATLKVIDGDPNKTPAEKDASRKPVEAAFSKREAEAIKRFEDGKAAADDVRKKDVAKAGEERDKDKGVADAREKMKRDLDKQRNDKVAQAAKDADFRKGLADLDAGRRKDLAEKAKTKALADAAVRAKDTLTGEQKADDLQKNAESAARDVETIATNHAKAQETRKRDRDEAARKAEELAIDSPDSTLTAKEKADKKKEIAEKYEGLKKEREKARDDQVAAAAEAKERTVKDAALERDHSVAQAQASDELKRKTSDLDQSLTDDSQASDRTKANEIAAIDSTLPEAEKKRKQDAIELEAAKRKNDLQARHDADVAKATAATDLKRAEADRKRVRDDADLAKRRELDSLAKETLTPDERNRRKTEIEQRHTDAQTKAGKQLEARKKDVEARRDEEVATTERTRGNADIDADPGLSASQKARDKKASEKTFLAAQKKAQTRRDEAKTELADLMSPQEKAAADALAAKAAASGDRVKNPYALSTRAKFYAVKARRWKEVITSFAIDVSTAAPPPPEEEGETATLKDLLPLARQFQLGDQAMALRLLRDPDVQAAAAISIAVNELRDEAREEMARSFALAEKGSELGVLTVEDKRKVLAREGVELQAGLSSAEVSSRFESYLDAAVARLQPTATQKAAILRALGIGLLRNQTVEEAYDKAIATGRTRAEKQMTEGMGLPPTRAQAFSNLIQP